MGKLEGALDASQFLVYLLQPQRRGQLLQRLQAWLGEQQTRIAGGILALVGLVLIVLGAQGLA